jgi:uncharacterized phosphosugar-binding protein
MNFENADTAKRYFAWVAGKLSALEREAPNVETAAQMIFEARQQGGEFFVFGTGHSHILAEEIYTRAGGYAPVRAMLPPEFMLHERPMKSTRLERLPGYAAELLALYGVRAPDVVMIVSNSGRNPVPVEMAALAKGLGCGVIALTSLRHSAAVTARNGGKRLFELADVVLDNHSEPGDAAFTVRGCPTPVGATSTITGAALVQALMACLVEKLAAGGQEPPVFRSSNLDGADEYNQGLFDKYVRERA